MARGEHRTHPDGLMLKDVPCSTEGCDRLCRKGMWLEDLSPLCHLHATRWRRTGDPQGVKSMRGRAALPNAQSMERRFLDALVVGERSGDGFTRHLLFGGYVDINGYGRLGGRVTPETPAGYVMAHRYAWEHWIGRIPEGIELDHRPECPKNCVNPAHLTPLTKSEHTTLEAARRGPERNSEIVRNAWATRRAQ